MPFPICKLRGYPQFDILPVAKITDYPLEKWDYKPFAQCRIAINEDTLFVQMWAFEVNPEPESLLLCHLLLPQKMQLQIFSDGAHKLQIGTQDIESSLFSFHPISGDDLQGTYWGGAVSVGLRQLLDGADIGNVKGNFYKLCTGSRPHSGSFFPVKNWAAPFEECELTEFNIIDF